MGEVTDADTPLADLPGHLLRRCHQISVAIFHAECDASGVTPLQFAILRTLLEGGAMDQATLGGLAAMDRTTVAVVLRKLEAQHAVRRLQSRADRRHKIVTLTERGRRLVAEVTGAVMRAQDRTMAPFDAAEAAEFTRLLRKLAEANNGHSRAPVKPRKTTAQLRL